MTAPVIPLEVWRRRVSLIRASVFAQLRDADLDRLSVESLDPAFQISGDHAGVSLKLYRIAYAAERRARSASSPASPATLLHMDFSI